LALCTISAISRAGKSLPDASTEAINAVSRGISFCSKSDNTAMAIARSASFGRCLDKFAAPI